MKSITKSLVVGGIILFMTTAVVIALVFTADNKKEEIGEERQRVSANKEIVSYDFFEPYMSPDGNFIALCYPNFNYEANLSKNISETISVQICRRNSSSEEGEYTIEGNVISNIYKNESDQKEFIAMDNRFLVLGYILASKTTRSVSICFTFIPLDKNNRKKKHIHSFVWQQEDIRQVIELFYDRHSKRVSVLYSTNLENNKHSLCIKNIEPNYKNMEKKLIMKLNNAKDASIYLNSVVYCNLRSLGISVMDNGKTALLQFFRKSPMSPWTILNSAKNIAQCMSCAIHPSEKTLYVQVLDNLGTRVEIYKRQKINVPFVHPPIGTLVAEDNNNTIMFGNGLFASSNSLFLSSVNKGTGPICKRYTLKADNIPNTGAYKKYTAPKDANNSNSYNSEQVTITTGLVSTIGNVSTYFSSTGIYFTKGIQTFSQMFDDT